MLICIANDFFLEHQSRDVRLLVACAIADVFRVYAPNAPYQHTEMIKHIFLFFIQQLKVNTLLNFFFNISFNYNI